jgi:hypothetical protein
MIPITFLLLDLTHWLDEILSIESRDGNEHGVGN